MTNLTQYEKGYSPCAIQHKYGLTYVQGYELAERLKKTQELELEVRRENTKLKELLKECRCLFNRSTVDGEEPNNAELIMILTKIEKVLGEEQ